MRSVRRQKGQGAIDSGFTLIELITVISIFAILSVTAISHYKSLVDDSRVKSAENLVAAVKSQLSLEFSRRAIKSLDLNVIAQPICDWVIVNYPMYPTSVSCDGALDSNVSITATLEDTTVPGSWVSPIAP